MTKHHTKKSQSSNNRMGTSVSVGPEIPNQTQNQIEAQTPENGFAPSYEDIQRRAYELHIEKGGSDLENWLEAERSLRESNT